MRETEGKRTLRLFKTLITLCAFTLHTQLLIFKNEQITNTDYLSNDSRKKEAKGVHVKTKCECEQGPGPAQRDQMCWPRAWCVPRLSSFSMSHKFSKRQRRNHLHSPLTLCPEIIINLQTWAGHQHRVGQGGVWMCQAARSILAENKAPAPQHSPHCLPLLLNVSGHTPCASLRDRHLNYKRQAFPPATKGPRARQRRES